MFADIIRTLRKMKGISQYQLAAGVGVSQQTVAKWEKDKANPDMATLKRLMGYFDVAADSFFNNSPSDEIQLIYGYRRLSDNRKRLVQELVAQLADGAAADTCPRVIQSNYQNTGGTNVVNVNGKMGDVYGQSGASSDTQTGQDIQLHF